MKEFFAFTISVMLVLSLTACGDPNGAAGTSAAPTETVEPTPAPIETSPPQESENIVGSQTPMSLDDLCELIEKTTGDGHSGYTVTHDEHMITITCWADGVAAELANGSADVKRSWGDLIESTKKILNSISNLLKNYGHEGVGVCYRMLNDLDHDKTLLYIVDGVVEYNVLGDQSDPTPEPTPAPTESTTMGQRNALSKAHDYLSIMAFSHSGLIKQLEYEGFTKDEATYGADNCGADWNEQAAKKAQDYMDIMSFSRQGLIDQLKYEGFTQSQAEYGVSAVGY